MLCNLASSTVPSVACLGLTGLEHLLAHSRIAVAVGGAAGHTAAAVTKLCLSALSLHNAYADAVAAALSILCSLVPACGCTAIAVSDPTALDAVIRCVSGHSSSPRVGGAGSGLIKALVACAHDTVSANGVVHGLLPILRMAVAELCPDTPEACGAAPGKPGVSGRGMAFFDNCLWMCGKLRSLADRIVPAGGLRVAMAVLSMDPRLFIGHDAGGALSKPALPTTTQGWWLHMSAWCVGVLCRRGHLSGGAVRFPVFYHPGFSSLFRYAMRLSASRAALSSLPHVCECVSRWFQAVHSVSPPVHCDRQEEVAAALLRGLEVCDGLTAAHPGVVVESTGVLPILASVGCAWAAAPSSKGARIAMTTSWCFRNVCEQAQSASGHHTASASPTTAAPHSAVALAIHALRLAPMARIAITEARGGIAGEEWWTVAENVFASLAMCSWRDDNAAREVLACAEAVDSVRMVLAQSSLDSVPVSVAEAVSWCIHSLVRHNLLLPTALQALLRHGSADSSNSSDSAGSTQATPCLAGRLLAIATRGVALAGHDSQAEQACRAAAHATTVLLRAVAMGFTTQIGVLRPPVCSAALGIVCEPTTPAVDSVVRIVSATLADALRSVESGGGAAVAGCFDARMESVCGIIVRAVDHVAGDHGGVYEYDYSVARDLCDMLAAVVHALPPGGRVMTMLCAPHDAEFSIYAALSRLVMSPHSTTHPLTTCICRLACRTLETLLDYSQRDAVREILAATVTGPAFQHVYGWLAAVDGQVDAAMDVGVCAIEVTARLLDSWSDVDMANHLSEQGAIAALCRHLMRCGRTLGWNPTLRGVGTASLAPSPSAAAVRRYSSVASTALRVLRQFLAAHTSNAQDRRRAAAVARQVAATEGGAVVHCVAWCAHRLAAASMEEATVVVCVRLLAEAMATCGRAHAAVQSDTTCVVDLLSAWMKAWREQLAMTSEYSRPQPQITIQSETAHVGLAVACGQSPIAPHMPVGLVVDVLSACVRAFSAPQSRASQAADARTLVRWLRVVEAVATRQAHELIRGGVLLLVAKLLTPFDKPVPSNMAVVAAACNVVRRLVTQAGPADDDTCVTTCPVAVDTLLGSTSGPGRAAVRQGGSALGMGHCVLPVLQSDAACHVVVLVCTQPPDVDLRLPSAGAGAGAVSGAVSGAGVGAGAVDTVSALHVAAVAPCLWAISGLGRDPTAFAQLQRYCTGSGVGTVPLTTALGRWLRWGASLLARGNHAKSRTGGAALPAAGLAQGAAVFEAAAYATAVVSQAHPVLLPLSFATALAQLVDRCGPVCASVLRGATVAVVHLLAAALRVSPITTAGSVWDGSKWALGFLSRVQRRWSADLAVARAVAGVYTVLVAWSVPTYQKPAHCAFAWLLKLELDSVVPYPTPEGAWQELCGQWQRRLTCRVNAHVRRCRHRWSCCWRLVSH